MRHLEKIWVRVLVSLLAGGFAQELFHISTGDPNRPEPPCISLIFWGAAFFMFFVLTMYVRIKK
jgi:hypothetical protein